MRPTERPRRRSQRLAPIALLLATFSAGTLVSLVACDKEKSNAEKMADEYAKSASAAKTVVDAAPDPAEIKYRERKKTLEQTVTDFKADEAHVMAGDPSATPGILRHYFESGADGDKAAKELEAKRKKDGIDGYRIMKAKLTDTRLTGTLEDAEVDVMEADAAKGTTGCLLFTLSWKLKDDKWVLLKQLGVKKVDCE